MQPDFSNDLTERSLAQAVVFANLLMPLVQIAFDHAVQQVRAIPQGGQQSDVANLQALPNMFRLSLIKMVAGVNLQNAGTNLRHRGSPNNGIWLGLANSEQMARVYKVSRRHPIRPSGIHQERLITQAHYNSRKLQRGLFNNLETPLLDAVLMWQSNGYDLTAAHVLVPNGWDTSGKLIKLAEQNIELPQTIDEIAAFIGVPSDLAILGKGVPILGSVDELQDEEFEFEDEDLAELFLSEDEDFGDVLNQNGEGKE